MTTGSLIAAMACSAQSTSDSVSGRGMNTPGPTASWARPNCTDPMRYCSGMRSARLTTRPGTCSTQVSSTSGVIPSRVRCTPSRWAASSSASTPGLGTPAPARVVVAAEIAPRSDTRLISAPAVPVASRSARSACASASRTPSRSPSEHRIQVVGGVADPVVGDPVLREVVGADPLGAVDRADLRPCGRPTPPRRLLLGARPASGRAGCASPAPCSAAGTSRSGRSPRCRSAGG